MWRTMSDVLHGHNEEMTIMRMKHTPFATQVQARMMKKWPHVVSVGLVPELLWSQCIYEINAFSR